MPLNRVCVQQLRNLSQVELFPAEGVNFLYGDNGSGKTSFLEALSLLAHGRSFRGHQSRPLIQHQASHLTVFGEWQEGNVTSRLGLHKPMRGASEYKVDGQPVYSSAALAALLPLQVMDASSFDLLTAPPKERRRLFDWLVFHVKHEFSACWRDYVRAVKQRNSLLRRDKIARDHIAPWDIEINRLGLMVDQLRQECFEPYIQAVQALLPSLGITEDLIPSLSYYRGWDSRYASLREALEDHFERDCRYGFTTQGPHKSELRVMVQGQSAGDLLSRGQQKAVVAALLVGGIQSFQTITGRAGILLLDDLSAELDDQRLSSLGTWLGTLSLQLFITATSDRPLAVLLPHLAGRSYKVFHVKHGVLTEGYAGIAPSI
jgi:DNA replication and repair protein RecF